MASARQSERLFPDTPLAKLGIHSSIYAGRSWGMRHRLPHARGTRRGMLILVLPLRTFGNGGAGELIDGGILARALMNPITAGINHPRHLAIARNIFTVVPGVPFRIDLGRHGHAADLQYGRHRAFRHFDAVREDLLSNNPRQVRSDNGRRDPLSPRRARPVGEGWATHHPDVLELIERQILGAALHRHVSGRCENTGNCQQLRQMLSIVPCVELLVVFGVDVDVHQEDTSAFFCHVLSLLLRGAYLGCEPTSSVLISAATAKPNLLGLVAWAFRPNQPV